MALVAKGFAPYEQRRHTKLVNDSSDTLRVILLTAYTYSVSHATIADVLAAGTEVANGNGYSSGGYTGGLALTGVTLSTSGATTTLSCSNPQWTNATFAASYAVFFNAQGATSNSTAYPFVVWDFGASQSSTASTYTLAVASTGLDATTSPTS